MNIPQLGLILEIIATEEKNYELNDYLSNYIKNDELIDCKSSTEVKEYLQGLNDNGEITQTEVIYYTNAIKYLSENDQSLAESISIAVDMGYELKNVNSELLASLLQSQNNENDFSSLCDSIETEIDNAKIF